MALATSCVVAGALLSSSTGRSVMSSAATNTAQHILKMVLGTNNFKEKNIFLSSRIQAKLECILYLFKTISEKQNEEKENEDNNYQKTMWNRVFCEMSAIQSLVIKMKKEQEEDAKSWLRYYWPRSQTHNQMKIISHLETIEEIIRFVSMVTPYIKNS